MSDIARYRGDVLAQEMEIKANSATVPAHLPFSPQEWTEMPVEERLAAMRFFQAEAIASAKGLNIEFPRLVYPSSGAGFWQIPTPEGEIRTEKAVNGVVLLQMPGRVYYPITDQALGVPPTCLSDDGIVPNLARAQAAQSDTCRSCQHAQWGSGKEGRGMACKSRTRVFVVCDGDEIPTLISLPPTAGRPFAAYVMGLLKGGYAAGLLGVVTSFGLVDATNSAGQKYKQLDCRVARRLTYQEMLKMKSLRDMFRGPMEQLGYTAAEERFDD